MVFEYHHFGQWVFGLPVGFGVQSGRPFRAGCPGSGSALCAGHLRLGAVCATVESSHDGAGSRVEGRRLLARKKPSIAPTSKLGIPFLYRAPSQKSQSKWGGPACILDIDASGVTARYRSSAILCAETSEWGGNGQQGGLSGTCAEVRQG